MDGRRRRRRWGSRTELPLRSSASQLSNTISCLYCDFKFSIFNEPIYRLGLRHSSFFSLWFSMGMGFSLATLLGVTVILLCELIGALLFYQGNILPISSSYFGLPSMITGFNISFPGFVYLFVSSIVSVLVHELGHALAAARYHCLMCILYDNGMKDQSHNGIVDETSAGCSEGVRIEYIAIFFAVLFPGALVAFNHASLHALSSLRIYCAGIWHNGVFCAVCASVLLLLPYILIPFYTYGEGPMVMDIPASSPMSRYLSPNDVIVSLDNTRIHTAQEWKRIIMSLRERTIILSSSQSNRVPEGSRGYCVPHSLIQESTPLREGNEMKCPDELTAFVSLPCLDYNGDDPNINLPKRVEGIRCLDAEGIVKLKKCSHNKMESPRNRSGCVCSKVESCSAPVLQPGLEWVEITYSSLDCQKLGRNLDAMHSGNVENSCLQTFVFVGDLISMARSIHLTSYQPRWSVEFAASLPNMMEKLLVCSFYVSLSFALLNSLPVYFLDGECMIEGIIDNFVSWNSARKRLILRCCLLGGTLATVILVLLMLFRSVVWPP